MANVLTVKNLCKNYGSIRALNGVSFSVPAGTIFGILGPNGSGKTTMLGIITNILKPTEGEVKLFDEAPTAAHRRRMGTLLETPNFYHYLSAVKNLEIAAAIKAIETPDIEGVLKKVNLWQRKDSKFQTFSLGMKQRLAIASCLLGNPDVMFFDEPTNGLDPVGIAEIRGLIKGLARDGKTVIMASHMLDEVEKVCTHVAILKKGELIAAGAVDEILVNDDVVEVGADDLAALKLQLQRMPQNTGVFDGDAGRLTIHFAPGTASLGAVNQFCFQQGTVLTHLQLKKKSLETKFIELTN
ncbi:MAG: ABC transporter ATP-binding protein [Bacteroidetes bacterium]|nr:MAG: ABC transporter ATP-binding protein [Bacteroidota bacterium]